MTSSTLQLGVIGDPVDQSPSPAMFNPALQELGIAGDYKHYHVKPADLESFFRRMRAGEIHGVNVTIPHKQAVIPFLDELTPEAKAIGAVNTIYFENEKLMGHNTDGAGYVQSLKNHLEEPLEELGVVVVGAGGASRAICYNLLKEDVGELLLVNRDAQKGLALVEHLRTLFPAQSFSLSQQNWEPFLQNGWALADVLINTTSLGLKNENPWPTLDFVAKLPKHCTVSDIVANPRETQLLNDAKSSGLRTIEGWEMLLNQALLAFEKFTQKKAPAPIMEQALLKSLTS